MKRQHSLAPLPILVTLLFTVTCELAHGEIFTFTWVAGGDGMTWTDSDNWTSVTGGSSPGPNDRAIFNQNANVSGGSAERVDIGAGATLSVETDTKTDIGSHINNQGVLTFSLDDTGTIPGIDTAYRVTGAVTLDGGGEVILNGSETGFGGGGTLTNVDNTIRGAGALDINVVNQGLIRVDVGELEVFASQWIDNSTGAFEIGSNGRVKLNLLSSIRGGVLAADAGAQLTGGTLRNLTITGPLLHGNTTLRDLLVADRVTQIVNTSTILEGAINNQGVLTFAADSEGNLIGIDTGYQVSLAATLNGGGEVVFNGSETGFRGGGVLTNADNTLRGAGGLDLNVVNQGLIRVEAGELELFSAHRINNLGGLIEIASDGQLKLNLQSIVEGGNVNVSQGAQVRGGTLRDLMVSGDLHVDATELKNVTIIDQVSQATNGRSNLAGTVTNQGSLTFAQDSEDNLSGIDTGYQVSLAATLNGGGEVVFNGSETGFRGGGVLTNADNTLRGAGGLDLNVVNQGLIRVEAGELELFSAHRINNLGGLIEIASDGQLKLNLQSIVEGGNVNVSQGAQVRGGTLRDLIVSGDLHVDATELKNVTIIDQVSQATNGRSNLAGTVTNQGSLTFAPDSEDNLSGIDTGYRVPLPTTLNGGGEVILNGSETGFHGGGALTNVDHTIRGAGAFDLNVVNQGLIRVEGGELEVFAAHRIDNAGGLIEVAPDGILKLNLQSIVQGGNVNADSGAQVRNGMLRDLIVTGDLMVDGTELQNVTVNNQFMQAVNGKSEFQGPIINQGVITFAEDHVDSMPGIDTAYQIYSNTLLEGGGELVLNGSETGIVGAGTLTNVDNTIRGSGTIGVGVVNQGTISPGMSPGRIAIDGFLDLSETSIVEFEVGGFIPGIDSDFVEVNGTASLDGTLDVNLINSFATVVRATDTFTILEATDIIGEFRNVANGGTLLTSDGQLSLQVNYGAGSSFLSSSVVLSNITAVPEPSTIGTSLIALAYVARRHRRRRSRPTV